MIVVLSLMRRD